MSSKRFNGDVGTGLVLLAIEIFFYVMSLDFINPDAARWPKAILLISAILSILLVISGLRETDYVAPEYKSLKAPLITLIMITLYAVAMDLTGFFVSTIIFCPLGMYMLGQRNWKAMIGVPVLLDVFVYVLFVTQLQMQMP